MLNFERIAEQRIEQAIKEGQFDDLTGRGLPIRLDDDTHVPESLRMAFRILNNSGMAPREVQVLNEINKLKQKIKQSDDKNYRQLLIHQMAILQTQYNF